MLKLQKRNGFFGKILGFIVDHFFGLVKILAAVAVAYIAFFKRQWAKDMFLKIQEWISELIANAGTNAKAIADKMAKPIIDDDARKAWTSKAKDATEKMAKAYREAGKDMKDSAELKQNAFLNVHSKDSINTDLAGEKKANIQADWLEMMEKLYNKLKEDKVKNRPKDVTGMARWVKENRPELMQAKYKAIRDAAKNPKKFTSLSDYVKI